MRIVVARRVGKRGEGLGNELIGWAKGFVASQALDAKLIGPSWGLNRRKYYRNFDTSRFDFLAEEFLTRWPHHAFTERDYRQTGEIDLGKALQHWARERGITERSSFIVSVDGMYGGFPAIRPARSFLWSKLLTSTDALRNVYQIASTLDPEKLFIAVHMRLGGDFETLKDGENPRGKFNLHIPPTWYLSICEVLRQQFGDRIHFHFFTDRRNDVFKQAVLRFNPNQLKQEGLTECSDLALMAQADLRVCSVSSYSMMASFLSDGPYIWYEPQLTYDGDAYTVWGHEEWQQVPGSLTMSSLEATRLLQPGAHSEMMFKGWPMRSESDLPPGLVKQLSHKLLHKSRSCNLLEFGSVPAWVVRA